MTKYPELKILNFYKYALYLLPLFIVTGNFLLNSVAAISIIFLLIIFIKSEKITKYLYRRNVIYLVIFFIYILISSLFSENFYSVKYFLSYLRFLPFILVFILLLRFDNKFEFTFTKIFTLSIFLLTIDGIFQYFYNFNLIGIEKSVPHRISGMFVSELILGSFISKYLFLFLIYFFYHNTNYKFFLYIPLSAMIFLTYVSGERVAFFSLMLFLTLFLFKIIRLNYFFIFFGVMVFILSLTTFLDPVTKDRMIKQTLSQTKIIKEWKQPKKLLIFSDKHNSHFQSAYLMFKKGDIKEKIFGRGIRSFRKNCSNKIFCDTPGGCCATHPHNIFFQLLSELGLIGVFIFFIFYSIVFLNFIKSFFSKNIDIKIYIINTAVLVNFFPLIPSGNFFGTFMSINYVILISFYLTYNMKNE